MIRYVLDTDTCVYWLKGSEEVRDSRVSGEVLVF
jgi:hypothetical protein